MRKLTVSGPPTGAPAQRREGVMPEQPPLAYGAALRALISCTANTARLLRDDVLERPQILADAAAGTADWWRPAAVS